MSTALGTLQEELSLLTCSQIVLQRLSVRIFLKFSQNVMSKARLKKFSQITITEYFTNQSEVSALSVGCEGYLSVVTFLGNSHLQL